MTSDMTAIVSLSSAWLAFGQAGTEATGTPAVAPVAAPAGQAISPISGTPITTAPGSVTATGTPAAKPNALQAAFPLFLMIGLLVMMIGFSFLASKKEKKRREALMSALKKGDRIVTSSGIVGEIHELLDNEVVLRLEEGRMRLSKASIATIL
jgi:preprotein translocase subunit YajC